MLSKLLTKLSFRASSWRRAYANAVTGGRGIEIGGPSAIFRARNVIPLYEVVSSLDASNFAAETLWQSNLGEGDPYEYAAGKPPGRRYIREATDLHGIGDRAYDFVFASHVIEHVANPLKALAEWSRIVREDGSIVLVVPHRDGTFDHRRPVTRLEHLIADEANAVTEDDKTHLEEWLALVDLERAPEAKPFEAFRERSLRNLDNRGIHHHVFDASLVIQMVDRAGLQIISVDHAAPFHILLIARKSRSVDNSRFLTPEALAHRARPLAVQLS